MHATQPQGGACPEPHRNTDSPAGWLAALLTDGARFRTWLASAVATAHEPLTLPDDTGSDGYLVTDAGLDALAKTGEAPGTVGSVLRSAALYLERHGWIQGAYYDPTATIFTPAADLVGAIGMVCYGGPVEAPAQHFDDPGFLDFEEAVLHLDRFLLAENGSESYEFNDARGRTVEQVTDVLRQAAARTVDELIDALRAVDTLNADMADRVKLLVPRGIWGDPDADGEQPSLVGHVEQSHLPGNLYGCPTCEQRCYCADLPWQCVHCARIARRDTDEDVRPDSFTEIYDDIAAIQAELSARDGDA